MNVRPSLNDVLDLCMARLQAGDSVEACVADYPEYAEELRDELEAASLFSQAFAFSVDQDRKRAARLRMHAALDRKASGWRAFRLPFGSGLFATGTRLAVAVAAVVMVLVFSGTGTVLASQTTVPGDVLYPVKRTTENVQLALAFTDTREASLREQLIERRTEELEAITTEDKERFVPGLVSDIIQQTTRVQVLATTPVAEVVDEANGQPPSGPTTAPGTPDPTQVPSVTPTPPSNQGRDVAVSIAPVLDLKDGMADLKRRLAMLEGRVSTAETKVEFERLRRSIGMTESRIDDLLQQVDDLRGERPADPPGRPIDQDDPTAPVATPTPEPTVSPTVVNNGRRTAVVRDVRLVENNGVSQLEIRAVLEDGSDLLVEIKRGGTLLLKDGKQARLRDLAVGRTLVLSIERETGRVLAVSIVPDRQVDRRDDANGRDTLNRGEVKQPTITIEPATVTRGAEAVRVEAERRKQAEEAEAARRAAEQQAWVDPTPSATPTPEPGANDAPTPTPQPTADVDATPVPTASSVDAAPSPEPTEEPENVSPTPSPTDTSSSWEDEPEPEAIDGSAGDAEETSTSTFENTAD